MDISRLLNGDDFRDGDVDSSNGNQHCTVIERDLFTTNEWVPTLEYLPEGERSLGNGSSSKMTTVIELHTIPTAAKVTVDDDEDTDNTQQLTTPYTRSPTTLQYAMMGVLRRYAACLHMWPRIEKRPNQLRDWDSNPVTSVIKKIEDRKNTDDDTNASASEFDNIKANAD